MTLLEARQITSSAPTPVSTATNLGDKNRLVDLFEYVLDAAICLIWELTYACNLSCVHCLSSFGWRDPRECTTDEAKAVIDELQQMQVFYVNIGGGEPTVGPGLERPPVSDCAEDPLAGFTPSQPPVSACDENPLAGMNLLARSGVALPGDADCFLK
jgi:hypothetical protein